MGARGRGLRAGCEGRGPDNPNTREKKHLALYEENLTLRCSWKFETLWNF